MFNFVNTNPVFSRIKRNENVYIFYGTGNVFSFASIYLIYRYFKSQGMLEKVNFIAVDSDKDYFKFHEENKDRLKKKNTRYFFIDCDLSISSLLTVINNCLSTNVIDTKPSVIQNLMSRMKNIPFVEIYNISFHSTNELTYIGNVWKLLTTEDPPEFVQAFNQMYLNPLSDVFGLSSSIRVLSKIKQDFNTWDNEFDSSTTSTRGVEFHIMAEFKETLEIGQRNGFGMNVFGMEAFCVNINRHLMQHMATVSLTSKSFDTVILFERTEHDYYYEVHTLSGKDLLQLFSKFKPHGFKNKIRFRSDKDILVKKPTLLKRLIGY